MTRLLCFLGATALVIALFVPLWQIDLDAPQYPEGLKLLIYPNAIAGDVEIINGLNHYIGMNTLHTEDFIEFTLLPYIIGIFAALVLATGLIGKKRLLFTVFVLFCLFGIVAMIDFWRWEYNYGHNLDPNAAIIVPGMAYQPPLIGFKQLLNFGAYSMPAAGGWLFVCCGVLLLFSVISESKILLKFWRNKNAALLLVITLITGSSCEPKSPTPIQVNKDVCSYCSMPIADLRFAAQLITKKGRVYNFDDVHCLKSYIHENSELEIGGFWVCDFHNPTTFINADSALFFMSDKFKSPMGGNMPAFKSLEEMRQIAGNDTAMPLNWNKVKSL